MPIMPMSRQPTPTPRLHHHHHHSNDGDDTATAAVAESKKVGGFLSSIPWIKEQSPRNGIIFAALNAVLLLAVLVAIPYAICRWRRKRKMRRLMDKLIAVQHYAIESDALQHHGNEPHRFVI